MTYIEEFCQYLQEKKISAVSVKNYRADVRKLISWYETEFNESFLPERVTEQILSLFREHLSGETDNGNTLSSINNQNISKNYGYNSLKRYESSLRKYFVFLKEMNYISISPMKEVQKAIQQDPNCLHAFRNSLYEARVAPLTLKNYMHDLSQFITWMDQVISETSASSTNNVLTYVSEDSVEEYKNRLLYDKNLSPASINRKLSSLRRFLNWARQYGYIKNYGMSEIRNLKTSAPLPTTEIEANPYESLLSTSLVPVTSLEQLPRAQETKNSQRFGPLRLFKNISTLSQRMIDISLIPLFLKGEAGIEALRFIRHGKSIFDARPLTDLPKKKFSQTEIFLRKNTPVFIPSIQNISKEFYAPFSAQGSFSRKLLYTLRHKRPIWYKKYHSYAFSHYLHFAVLMLSLSIMGYFFMNASGLASWQKSLAFAHLSQATPHVLSYTGILKDSKNNPITASTNVRFAIYSDQSASASGSVWQENQVITPNPDGTFTTTLGHQNTLSDDIFRNASLYLGISIAGGQELRPRQQIATVDLAKSSDTLAGMRPITETNNPRNAVLALDSAGNLSINGTDNTTFQSTDGIFSLAGQSLLMTTNAGSNGSIVLQPDGSGFVDIKRPIQNTSEDIGPSGLTGAVEVADTLAISATSSAQSALYINQNGSSPIISAISNGIAKFGLGSDGTAFFTGNVGIGTPAPSVALDVNGSLRANHIGLGTLPDDVYNLTSTGPIRASTFVADQLRTTVSDDPTLVKLLVNSPASQSADLTQWQVGGTTLARVTASGNFGIGTDAITEKLSVGGNISVQGNILLQQGSRKIISQNNQPITLGDNQTGNILLTPNGKIGVGTNSPFAKLQVSGGGLCVGTDTQCVSVSNNDSTVYASQLNTTYTDVAESYPTNDASLTPGDVVSLDENTGVFVQKASLQTRDLLFGVISTQPGVRLGGFDGEKFQDARQVPVGLSGRVPVKVTTENGLIHIGDPLTLSSTPGVAKKATGPGMILGTALGDYTDTTQPGTVLLFINKTWYDTNTYITDSGDVSGIVSQAVPQTGNRLIDSLISALQQSVKTTTLVADTIIVNGKELGSYIADTIQRLPTLTSQHLISPIADIERVNTHIISPLGADGQIALRLDKKQLSILNGTDASSSAVATIDNNGNASFSGSLQSQSLLTKNASIDGTLRARHIIADQIDGLATSSAQYITNITNIYSASDAASGHQASQGTNILAQTPLNTDTINISSLAGVLAYTPRLQTDYQTITQGLMSFGPTSLADTSIAGQLAINGSMILSDNSLNVLGADLALQPLRQGGLSFEGGLIAINTDGDLSVNGNALFAKNVSVQGKLAANIISPLPDHDLIIQLGEASSAASLIVQNASGSSVLRVNQAGDVSASGTGIFKTLLSQGFSIIRSAQADTSVTETVASSSAGTAVITPGHTERTIYSPFVGENSLIYITPTSDTGNLTPYLARQSAQDSQNNIKGSFTISIPQPTSLPIKVNWVIVN